MTVALPGDGSAGVAPRPTIGVLALQGCVDRHRPHVEAAGGTFLAARTPADFAAADGLILPGGESTTMLKLIDTFDLEGALARAFAAKPVWGICAGTILMADVVRSPAQRSFHLLPITVVRNGYGRQLDSAMGEVDGYPVSYIRAPIIEEVHGDVEVRASRDGKPVWLVAGRYMATTFHAELTRAFPSPMHREFLNLIGRFHAAGTDDRTACTGG